MAAFQQQPGGMYGGESDVKMEANILLSPRNVLSGVRYSNIGQSTDELDIAEELLRCIRNLPCLESLKTAMDGEHEQAIIKVSNGADESLQPIVDIVLNDSKVINAIYDINNKYDEIEFMFNCIFALMTYVTEDEFINNVNKFCNIFSKQSNEFITVNVKLLSLLFNLVPRGLYGDNGNINLRAFIMQRILELISNSKSNNLANLWKARLKELIKWIDDWKLNPKSNQKRNLFYFASQVLSLTNDKALEQEYLLLFLQTFDNPNDINDLAITVASNAMIGTITNDEINTKVIRNLRKNVIFEKMSNMKEHNQLCELMTILYSGNVKDYENFFKTNEKYIESIGINNDRFLDKMRILTLCSLGHTIKLISFDKLKNELLLESLNDIESTVIEGIKRKLIEARIDHLRKQVIINRTALRVFEKESWDEIAAKLSLWKENTQNVINVISNAGLTRFYQQMASKLANDQ